MGSVKVHAPDVGGLELPRLEVFDTPGAHFASNGASGSNRNGAFLIPKSCFPVVGPSDPLEPYLFILDMRILQPDGERIYAEISIVISACIKCSPSGDALEFEDRSAGIMNACTCGVITETGRGYTAVSAPAGISMYFRDENLEIVYSYNHVNKVTVLKFRP